MLSKKQWLVVGVLALIAILAYDQTRGRTKKDALFNSSGVKVDEATSHEWKLFHPQNEKFQVLLPALPQYISEVHTNANLKVKYEVYAVQQQNGTSYIITMMTYPQNYDTSKPDELLEGVMRDMVGAKSQNELLNSDKNLVANSPALDFKVKNNDFTMKSRAVLAGKTIYVLTAMEKQPATLDADFSKFADSFVPKLDAPVK